MLRKLMNRDRGFTMIEMLITVALVGIIAAIAIPIYTGQQSQAYKATAVSDGRAWSMTATTMLMGTTGLANGGTFSVNASTGTLLLDMPGAATDYSGAVAVSNGSSITQSGTGTNSTTNTPVWCFVVANNGQNAVFTQAGYQTSATSCSTAGIAS